MEEFLEKEYYKFSVLMPIYIHEKDNELRAAIDSVINQTLMPDEILIIADKNIPQNTRDILDEYKSKYPEIFNPLLLTEQANIGKALRVGVESAKNPLVAIMNSKDISVNNRFEKQIKYLKDHPDIDIVGSWATEFEENAENIYALKELPDEHDNIYKFSKFRNPIIHTTALFKKSSVIKSGNYVCRKQLSDYDLWVSMLYKGCKFANIPECLVNLRMGKDAIISITGRNKAFLYEYGLFERFLDSGFINFKEFVKAVTCRFLFRILSNNIRLFIYKNIICRKVEVQ